MQLNRIAILGLLCVNVAHAEISVVDEISKVDSVHTARVISKEPYYHEIVKTVPKVICRRVIRSIHYDPKGTVELMHSDQTRCRTEMYREKFKVLKGYSVVYEYNDQYHSAVLSYDPGKYVQVNSGK